MHTLSKKICDVIVVPFHSYIQLLDTNEPHSFECIQRLDVTVARYHSCTVTGPIIVIAINYNDKTYLLTCTMTTLAYGLRLQINQFHRHLR